MPRVINVRNIPDEVFREFKAECAMNDVDMTTAIVRFMNLFIQRGDWEVTGSNTSKHYRNLFMAVEQNSGNNTEFYVKKKGELSQ